MLATLQAEIVVAQCKTEAKAVDMSTALMTSSENAAVKEELTLFNGLAWRNSYRA